MEEAPHSVKHSPFMTFHVNLDHIGEQTWMLRDERFGRPDFHHPASGGSFSACLEAIGRRQRIVSWLHGRHPIARSQCSFYCGHLAPTPASPDQLLITTSRRFKRHHRPLSDFLGEPRGVEPHVGSHIPHTITRSHPLQQFRTEPLLVATISHEFETSRFRPACLDRKSTRLNSSHVSLS